MNVLITIQSQLGVMTWPLALLSLLTVMILLERSLFLCFNSITSSNSVIETLRNVDIEKTDSVNQYIAEQALKRGTLPKGIAILFIHKNFDKELREETVSIWLTKKRQEYISGLRFLSVIGVISPLIGLLGTVLGLIEMFNDLSATSGSIAPSDLAQGLGLAMSTTAAGLIIAVPAIFGSQILQLWAERSVAQIEHVLNHCNLFLEGISIEKNRDKVICSHAPEGQCDQVKNNNAQLV